MWLPPPVIFAPTGPTMAIVLAWEFFCESLGNLSSRFGEGKGFGVCYKIDVARRGMLRLCFPTRCNRRLVLAVKPAVVKIVLSEEQIYAGRPIAARCETWGSSPAARIVWRLGGQVIGDPNVATTQRSNSTVSKLALALGKHDDGKELTCRAENPRFPGGVLEQTKVLNVACESLVPSTSRSLRRPSKAQQPLYLVCLRFPRLDAPVVAVNLATGYVLDILREGDDLKLVCIMESNPPPTTVNWYHNVSKE